MIVRDRVLVVNRGDQSFIRDEQERHSWRFVDAAALSFNDSILDLIRHAKSMAATDSIRGLHELDRISELNAINRSRTPTYERDSDIFAIDGNCWIPESHSHDRLNDFHRLVEMFEGLGLMGCAENVGVS